MEIDIGHPAGSSPQSPRVFGSRAQDHRLRLWVRQSQPDAGSLSTAHRHRAQPVSGILPVRAQGPLPPIPGLMNQGGRWNESPPIAVRNPAGRPSSRTRTRMDTVLPSWPLVACPTGRALRRGTRPEGRGCGYRTSNRINVVPPTSVDTCRVPRSLSAPAARCASQSQVPIERGAFRSAASQTPRNSSDPDRVQHGASSPSYRKSFPIDAVTHRPTPSIRHVSNH